ncbi:MAG: hypothetical protein ACOCVP_02325 [Wenzhouxiangella sp.]
MVLLSGPVLMMGALPARSVLLEVWPRPVEELVLADGRWVIQPARWNRWDGPDGEVRARTRPWSVLELQLDDGSRLRGYLIEQTPAALVLQTGPDQHHTVAVSSTAFKFTPNNMRWRQRMRLAWARLNARLPVSRTPSPR